MVKQRRYEKQFKPQAARLVAEHGYSFKDAAERLGVSTWTLRDWVKKLRGSGELATEGETGTVADEMACPLRGGFAAVVPTHEGMDRRRFSRFDLRWEFPRLCRGGSRIYVRPAGRTKGKRNSL